MAKRRFRFSLGVICAIASPLLYSITIPLAKILLERELVDPWMLAGLLDLFAGLGIAAVYNWRNLVLRKPSENPLQGKDWRWLWGSIFIGGMIAPVMQTFGIAYSPAATASLLLNLEGVITSLIAWIIFREVFDRRVALGLTAITLGSAILIWHQDSELSLSVGSLAIVVACFAWATSTNLTHKVSSKDSLQVVMFRTGISGLFNVILALTIGNPLPQPHILAIIALAGAFCVGLTFLSFMVALRHIGTSRASTFFALFPFAGAIWSVLVLGEALTLQLLIAAGFMAIGLWFCTVRARIKSP
jgi:drug/metabolite transporter (DMT)-like permease